MADDLANVKTSHSLFIVNIHGIIHSNMFYVFDGPSQITNITYYINDSLLDFFNYN